ncbi:hypothetical protein HOA92_02775 [archaeon]|jgi:broad specificity phosphatase PhoE|nr:hypothetical protein [archaeon]MBT6761939.1 hypothetical protein [archaeon]
MSRLFLTRHYQTLENKWRRDRNRLGLNNVGPKPNNSEMPSIEGLLQPIILSRYLKTRGFDYKNSVLVTSDLRRSNVTGVIAYKLLGANFSEIRLGRNYFPRPGLQECSIRSINASKRRHIGDFTHDVLRNFMRWHEGKDVLAVLHGNRNRCFLGSLGEDTDYFGNCAVVELKMQNDSLCVTRHYISLLEMNKEMAAK